MNAFIILIALIAAAVIYYNLRPSDELAASDQSGGLYARYPWWGRRWWGRPWLGWRGWRGYPWRGHPWRYRRHPVYLA